MAASFASVSSYSSLDTPAPGPAYSPGLALVSPSDVYDAGHSWEERFDVASPLLAAFDALLGETALKIAAVGGIIPAVAIVAVVAVVAVIAYELKSINAAVTAKGREASGSWLDSVANGLNELDIDGAVGRM